VPIPVFDFIPIIQESGKVRLRVVVLSGVSTRHESPSTRDGKIFARITPNWPVQDQFTFEGFTDPARLPADRVLYGVALNAGEQFELVEDNSSGMSGKAIIDDGTREVVNPILIVSFATDEDVFGSYRFAQGMPGYDSSYGLAAYHARAMRQILTSILPEAVPQFYAGKTLSAFEPLASADELPELGLIRNPAALEKLQADLVKQLSAEEAENTEEFADMADKARQRVAAGLKSIALANPLPEDLPPENQPPGAGVVVQFGSWKRG